MSTDWTNFGMNEKTAKDIWGHLSKSGPAASVAIGGILLYFAGTVWSCLACGPVRTIILTIIAWFSQAFILYTAAKKECSAKIDVDTAGKVAIRALYPTAAFIVGYVFVPWFLPTPLSFLSRFGPTKVVVPAACGGLTMIATNYILNEYLDKVGKIC